MKAQHPGACGHPSVASLFNADVRGLCVLVVDLRLC
jgi:hypothetical protein